MEEDEVLEEEAEEGLRARRERAFWRKLTVALTRAAERRYVHKELAFAPFEYSNRASSEVVRDASEAEAVARLVRETPLVALPAETRSVRCYVWGVMLPFWSELVLPPVRLPRMVLCVQHYKADGSLSSQVVHDTVVRNLRMARSRDRSEPTEVAVIEEFPLWRETAAILPGAVTTAFVRLAFARIKDDPRFHLECDHLLRFVPFGARFLTD